MPLSALGALGAVAAACDDGGNELPEPPKTVEASHQVPSIIGGTLLMSRDGQTAIAADPDRDRISLVDIGTSTLKATVQLERFAEPGRVVEDGAGQAHVALRRAGEIATIDIASGELLRRSEVCASPRGMAYDETADSLFVACASGDLAVVDPAGLEVLQIQRLERDLRDVVLMPGDALTSVPTQPELFVSLFRTAQILKVADPLGTSGAEILDRRLLPSTAVFDEFTPQADPRVAWRVAAMGTEGLVVAHQQHLRDVIDVAPMSSYGSAGPCGTGIVQSQATIVPRDPSQPAEVVSLNLAVLPVDVAAKDDGSAIAVAAAGTNTVSIIDRGAFSASAGLTPCGGGVEPGVPVDVPETPVAVAFSHAGDLLIQTREPALLITFGGARVELGGESVLDSGHELFHRPPGAVSLSCASCHPEGGDDAHTWNFSPFGARRTQSLRGGILQTAPLHWDGTLSDMGALVDEVMILRMGGIAPGPRGEQALARWIDRMAPLTPSPSRGADAIARGQALFHDPVVGCADCHNGPLYTNNDSVDVGTGQVLQVASLLNIADRAPYMHDGCAASLEDRFAPGPCGGGDQHGKTSHLDAAQVDDLIAFLETL